MSGMVIRRYSKSDWEALIQLWTDVFPDDPAHNESSKMIRAKLLVDDLVFVAEDQERIIGACMAGYDGHRGWLYSVAVSSGKRRMGIGKKLIEEAINSLKELGCVKVNLQIRATDHEVKGFYESLGFLPEERLSMGMLLE